MKFDAELVNILRHFIFQWRTGGHLAVPVDDLNLITCHSQSTGTNRQHHIVALHRGVEIYPIRRRRRRRVALCPATDDPGNDRDHRRQSDRQ